ncbi:MAG: hypothetical protein ACRDYU_13130 [Actinomycetes bacterium]
MRKPLTALLSIPLILGLGACSDDGATTRTASGSGSGSGSASAMGSASGSASAMGSASGSTAAGAGHAVPEGVAHEQALMHEEVEEAGGETRTGEWRIGYIVEAAEPWFTRTKDGQHFRPPAKGETHHIEILPVEASTGRLVPETPIRVEVVDEGGKVVDAKRLNFYYTEFYHYANNFSVPESGTYSLRVTVGQPEFFVHGEKGETPPLSKGAKVTFDDVRMQPGG